MENSKLFSFLIALVTVTVVFYSCKKTEDKAQVCKIIQAKFTDGGADTSSIYYTFNSDNKLIKNDNGKGFYYTYIWETGKVTSKYYSNGSLSFTEVYTLNSNENAISSTFAYAGASVSKNTTYEYNSDGYMTKKTIEPTAVGVATDYYTYDYNSGNLVSEHHTQSLEGNFSGQTTYEYYGDKENSFHVLLNVYGKGSANLVKKVTNTTTSPISSTTINSYSYLIASDKKVQKITYSFGGDRAVYLIPVYECN